MSGPSSSELYRVNKIGLTTMLLAVGRAVSVLAGAPATSSSLGIAGNLFGRNFRCWASGDGVRGYGSGKLGVCGGLGDGGNVALAFLSW